MKKIQLSYLILFAISFGYLLLFGNRIFFHQENRSLFIFSLEYLEKHLLKPGGLLKYFAAFLLQGYYLNFYGAAVNSLLVVGLATVVNSVVKRLLNYQTLYVSLVLLIPLGIIICQADYQYSILNTLGFLLSLLWFLLSIIRKSRLTRIILLLLFPLFYYISGTYALLSLGIYLVYVIFYGKEKRLCLFAILQIIVLALVLSASYFVVFMQPFKVLIGYPLVFNEFGSLTIPFIILSGIIILFPALTKIADLGVLEKHERIISPVTVFIIVSSSLFVLFRQYNSVFEKVMKTEKLFFNHDYDKVISEHEKNASSNIVDQFYYNLALSEKGKLCERMFFGRQEAGPMSLSLGGSREQASRTMHYYYAIGLVNEARHLAFELMVNNGYMPENLKMLIKTELLNGNFRVAERYINILKSTLRYRSLAQKYEKLAVNPELVKADPELGEKIRLMPEEDFFIHTEDVMNTELLLKSNPLNRKAFEYKMARLLLEKDIIAVAEEVKNMKARGYTSIPRHIDEAIVAYRNYSNAFPEMEGLTTSSDIEERFIRYVQTVNRYKGDKMLIEKTLNKREKNTFWFYLQFGKISSDFMRSKPVDRDIY